MKHSEVTPDSAVVSGTLARNGIRTRCQVSLSVDDWASNPPAVYSQCTVLGTEERLTDGIYELEFLDQSAFVRLQAGVWSTGRPWLIRREPSRELSIQAA
ncbi:MAG TPA: hypothetical protein VMD29_15940 [Terracidiphilus sp.]|jgi:hypothetical protein|nr:hypothetical protein [Terracidiphilus sp.]